MIGPLMLPLPSRRLVRRVAIAATVGFAAFNVLAWHQARALTHFERGAARTPPPQFLSVTDKARLLLTGPTVPRPENRRDLSALGLTSETYTFPGSRGVPLEAWLMRAAEQPSRGLALGFHGHADCKSSQLPAAKQLWRLGWDVLLVDFYGSGGSGGTDTTIGWREAEDVTAAVTWARSRGEWKRMVAYGESMGAASILKAAHDGPLPVDGVMLACPFDRLSRTVQHRFSMMNVPPFPAAHILLFWGGVQGGFDAFAHNPAEFAHAVRQPALLMNGGRDPWVRREEAQAVFDALAGPKQLKWFEDLGHESFLKRRDEWVTAVGRFLGEIR